METQQTPRAARHHTSTLAQSFEHGLAKGAQVPPETTVLWSLPFVGLFLALFGFLLFRALRFFLRITS